MENETRLARTMQRDLDRLFRTVWSVRMTSVRRVENLIPIRSRPELSGVKLATYNTTGLPRERGNRHPSARGRFSGKPPSPVMSRRRDGAVVVVRTRESRVHGEGRQSTSAAAAAPEQAMYVVTKGFGPWLLNVAPSAACAESGSLTFASTSMESPVRNERRTPGSVRGTRKPARGQPE